MSDLDQQDASAVKKYILHLKASGGECKYFCCWLNLPTKKKKAQVVTTLERNGVQGRTP